MDSYREHNINNAMMVLNHTQNTYKKTFDRAHDQLTAFAARLREASEHKHARHYHTFCLREVTSFSVCNSTNKRARACARYIVQFILEASREIHDRNFNRAAELIDEALVYVKKGQESYVG